jgi:hypothetical protein
MKTRKGGMFEWLSKPKVPPTVSPTVAPSNKVLSPFFNGATSQTVYTAKDYMNTDGIGSRLTQGDVDEIDHKIEAEISDPSSTNTEVDNGLTKATQFEGKIKKAIVGAIAAYNIAEKSRDSVNIKYINKKVARSEAKCGSVTCKVRGRKITNALKEILTLGDSTLGSIGVLAAASTILNYGANNIGIRTQTQGGRKTRRR